MKHSSQELFLQANGRYAKKDYPHAAQLYEKIPQKSAAIWYNMGNCAYKNGDDMHALLYWKRAQKQGNRTMADKSIANSILVNNKLNLPFTKPAVITQIPMIALQILFFCMFSVFLIFSRRLYKAGRSISLITLSIFIMVIGAMTYASYHHATAAHALVMDGSTLYAGPNDQYHEIATIATGSEVTIKDHKNGWKKVSWNGQQGWIQQGKIEVI